MTIDVADLLEPAVRKAFSLPGQHSYLDTATMGVPTNAGASAAVEAIARWQAGQAGYLDWEAEALHARQRLAGLLGCAPTDLAMLPSLTAAAASIALQRRSGKVVVFDAEYRSNLLPWLIGSNDPVVLPGPTRTDRLLDNIDAATALVVVSTVQSLDGARLDVESIVAAAHAVGAQVFLDGTQSVGALQIDVRALDVDFVGVSAYKWLLGARGCSFLYVRPDLQPTVTPIMPSARAPADADGAPPYGVALDWQSTAARLDQPLAWLPWLVTRHGIDLIADIGIDRIERHVLALRDALVGAWPVGAADPPEGRSQVALLPHPDPTRLYRELHDAGIRTAVRPSGLRVGLHLYNDAVDVERLVHYASRLA